MGRSQVVRQRVLVPPSVGSNPTAPAIRAYPSLLIFISLVLSNTMKNEELFKKTLGSTDLFWYLNERLSFFKSSRYIWVPKLYLKDFKKPGRKVIPFIRDNHPLGRRVVRAMSLHYVSDRAQIPKPNDVGVIYDKWYER